MRKASEGFSIERAANGSIRVAGTLGFANAGAALPEGDAFTSRAGGTEVDLSGLADADSATLALILAWGARATQRGEQLRYRGVPEDLRALARLAEVEPLLGMTRET
ncbi:MAG: STAS domain-containing protein [Rhodanobacteraceae bacterium]